MIRSASRAARAALSAALLLTFLARAGTAAVTPWQSVPVPPDLSGQPVVCDAAGRLRIVIAERRDGLVVPSEAWAASLDSDFVWRQIAASGPPGDRFGAIALYDHVSGSVLLTGGGNGYYTDYTDVWALDPRAGTWQNLAPDNGAVNGNGLVAAIDTHRHRLIVFGGGYFHNLIFYPSGATAVLPLDGTPAWTTLAPPWSPQLMGAVGAYDPVNDRLVVHGGRCPGPTDSGHEVDSTWALSLSGDPQWHSLPNSAVHPFTLSMMVADSASGALLAVGHRDTLWRLSLSSPDSAVWQPQPVGGSLTIPDGPVAWDAATRSFVTQGVLPGDTGQQPSFRTARLALGPSPSWTLMPGVTRPIPRQGHRLVHDATRDQAWLFGGRSSIYPTSGGHTDRLLGDILGLDAPSLESWVTVQDSGNRLTGATAILDVPNDRLLVFGGQDIGGAVATLLEFSFGANAWSQLAPAGPAPGARAWHSAVVDEAGRRMIVFGGAVTLGNGSVSSVYRDAFALNLDGPPTWTPLDSAAVGRWGHSAIWDPQLGRMIVFGGSTGTSDLAVLTPGASPAWTSPAATGTIPPATTQHLAVLDTRRNRMLVVGAGTMEPYALDLSSLHWDLLAPPGDAPILRSQAAGYYDGRRDRLVLFGGAPNAFSSSMSDLWALDFDDPTPALASLIRAEVVSGVVRLAWQVSEPGSDRLVLERLRTTDWIELATLVPDGLGRVEFRDRDVHPGDRLTYRLRATDGTQRSTLAQVTVVVPRLSFKLAGASPQPCGAALRVTIALPDGAPAILEAFDVTGRRVAHREVGQLGPGDHEVELADGRVAPGVYSLRLRHGADVLRARTVVLR